MNYKYLVVYESLTL